MLGIKVRLTSIAIFGAICGIAWSFIPGFLSDLINHPKDAIPLIISGGITGTMISLMISALPKLKKPQFIFLIILITPLVITASGLIFGVLLGLSPIYASNSNASIRINQTINVGAYAPYAYFWTMIWWALLPISFSNIAIQKLVLEPRLINKMPNKNVQENRNC